MRKTTLVLGFAALSALFWSPVGHARALKPVSVTSSSTLPADEGVTYDPENMVDHKQSTVWCEGDTGGSGMGTDLQFNLDGKHKVTEIHIWNGNWYSADYFVRHNRIKELEISFSDGTSKNYPLKDERVVQVVKLDKPVDTEFVKMRVKNIYSGSTFNDTVISEVVIYDDAPEEAVPVASYKASTTYPADADGDYEADNVGDLVTDSMWCEGAKDDGANSWLEFDFGATKQVSRLTMVSGNGYSAQYWMKGNRPVKADLTFSDGSKQSVEIKKTFMPQTITFTPVSTAKVRVTFTEVAKGSDPAFHDLCVSEASFLP